MKTSSIVEIAILIIALVTFFREVFGSPPEQRTVLYITFLIILVLIGIGFAYYFIKTKFDEIKDNKEKIAKLEQELDFAKNMEKIKIDLEILKKRGEKNE